jgi:virginiamycin B lyase
MVVFMVFSLAGGLVRPQAASAAPYDITEYPIPSPGIGATVIAEGPDGNLWFTIIAANKVGRIDPNTGTITEYTIPSAGSFPTGIAQGPDGNMWFTAAGSNIVAKIEPGTGTITEYPVPTNSDMGTIVAGPDGNMWFTQYSASQIASVDPNTGVVTEYPTPTPNSGAAAIIAGPDGNLWFTQRLNNSIARLEPGSGTITEYPLPTAASDPIGLAAVGTDIWFTQKDGNRLATIATGNGAIAEYPTLAPGSQPHGVLYGPDGRLWVALVGTNEIGSFDLSGNLVDTYPIPTANSSPYSIITGPDSNIWFTQFQGDGNNIGMLEMPDLTTDASITKTLLNQGEINVGDTVSYEVIVTNTGESTLSGTFDATDYFPNWLNYASADLPGGSCQAYQPGDPNLAPILEAYLPSHTEYGGIQCAGMPAPIAPQASVSLQFNFTAVSAPGRDNYVAFGLDDVNEDDQGISGLLVGGNPGDDLVDNWEASSPKHNNMAVARYVDPNPGTNGSSELAESGAPLVGAMVTAAAGLPAVLITRRRQIYTRR